MAHPLDLDTAARLGIGFTLTLASCGGTETLEVGTGPPARLVLATAATASAFAENVVAPPAVRVLDAAGRVLPGVAVTFRVEGGGDLATARATTNAEGLASPGGWRLGAAPGTQRLIAEAGDHSVDYVVQVAPEPAGSFRINVIFDGDAPSPEEREAVLAATARWETLIVGDLPDMRLPEDVPAECPLLLLYPFLNVDDLLIIVSLRNLPVGTIGTTVLCHRRPGGGLPSVASIKINPTAAAQSSGLFRGMLHEIGHALGFGTIWPESLLRDRSGDLRFLGRNAEAAYLLTFGGSGDAGAGVPVETGGGTALARSHWRESVFDRELLTPYSQNADQPLSAITAASLRDLGYVVNDARADPYARPGVASPHRIARRP